MDFIQWIANAPDDFWAAERLWRFTNFYPDWWKLKAAMQLVCFVLVFLFPHAIGITVRLSRWICAMGSLTIALTLWNWGFGPIGDLIFTFGFMMICVLQAAKGVRQRNLEAKALAEAGVAKMTPEKAAYLAVTGQISSTIAHGK